MSARVRCKQTSFTKRAWLNPLLVSCAFRRLRRARTCYSSSSEDNKPLYPILVQRLQKSKLQRVSLEPVVCLESFLTVQTGGRFRRALHLPRLNLRRRRARARQKAIRLNQVRFWHHNSVKLSVLFVRLEDAHPRPDRSKENRNIRLTREQKKNTTGTHHRALCRVYVGITRYLLGGRK